MNNLDLMEIAAKVMMSFVPFLLALSIHEWAHGFVAHLRGDNTAKMMGRLTLNPVAHADPIGTFALPLLALFTGANFFFGWAKPVPVNSRNMKKPNLDMFLVAVAGPLSNLLLSLIGTVLLAFVFWHFRRAGTVYEVFLVTFMRINLFLAIFNLIPIHPLDGGKVLEPFLPASWNMWLEQNQGALNIGLLIFLMLAGGIVFGPVSLIMQMLYEMARNLAMIL